MGCRYLNDIRLRIQQRHGAFHGYESSCQHADAFRHGYTVLVCNGKDLLNRIPQIDLIQVHMDIFLHEDFHIVIKQRVINPAVVNSQRQDDIDHQLGIIASNGLYCLFHKVLVAALQGSHHAKINPDDLSIPYAKISRMRVSVEKAVVHDLLDVVLCQLGGNFPKVIAAFLQCFAIVNDNAVNVFHDQHPAGRVGLLNQRRTDIGDRLMIPGKFHGKARLIQKIHFLLCGKPEFIHHDIDIDDAPQHLTQTQQLSSSTNQGNIPFHHLIDVRTLHLDNDFSSIEQRGLMHLRNGSGTQRYTLKAGEYLLHGTAVFFLYDALYICKGQRCDIIPQLDKLLAIAFTEHILPACHDLSDFNEGRTQIFQNFPKLNRINSLCDMMLFQNSQNLSKPAFTAQRFRFIRIAHSPCLFRVLQYGPSALQGRPC
ncbi:unknown [Erysipelotrichaceae bacterium CAG:64]|nr:unknown [Erysipelotrichaceae bacterium CAG:64]